MQTRSTAAWASKQKGVHVYNGPFGGPRFGGHPASDEATNWAAGPTRSSSLCAMYEGAPTNSRGVRHPALHASRPPRTGTIRAETVQTPITVTFSD